VTDPASREGAKMKPDDEARLARRQSFDPVAALYNEMRPGYPQAVFDDVIAIAGVGSFSHLLEIGCGSGHATLMFARRNLRIDCVELGENMAALARKNLAAFPRVTVTLADFDIWNPDPQQDAGYDLVYSATAYHWLNPETRIERIARLLAPAGWVAVWRNHHVRGSQASEDFFRAAQTIYAREAPALAAKFTGQLDPDQIQPVEKEEWLASGLFRDAQTRVYCWSKEYTALEYVRMLDTHSDHRLLAEANRQRLFAGLVQLAGEFGGSITREHATILHMAHKA
jgi:trans-aconitate methyltransferase